MRPQTLKELLKPPFSHDGIGVSGEIYVGVNGMDYKGTRIAQVRGWGFFQNFENGDKLQDEFKDFLVAALNEKWERDFGEQLQEGSNGT
jgi:predicted heme/steroid binding protein